MKKVRITTAWNSGPPVRIEDLKLTIHPDGHEDVDEKRAKESICLQNLFKSKQVCITYLEESVPVTKPTIHTVTMSRPSSRPLSSVPLENNPPQKSEDLKDMLKGVALEAARIATESARQPDIEKMIERAVMKALSSMPIQNAVASGSARDIASLEEPVFIPTGIVGNEKVEVTLTSGTSDNSGLDEATKSLKAIKGTRKNKDNVEKD
jgi:hypothetical protein